VGRGDRREVLEHDCRLGWQLGLGWIERRVWRSLVLVAAASACGRGGLQW
jgi:hypothetical protein